MKKKKQKNQKKRNSEKTETAQKRGKPFSKLHNISERLKEDLSFIERDQDAYKKEHSENE